MFILLYYSSFSTIFNYVLFFEFSSFCLLSLPCRPSLLPNSFVIFLFFSVSFFSVIHISSLQLCFIFSPAFYVSRSILLFSPISAGANQTIITLRRRRRRKKSHHDPLQGHVDIKCCCGGRENSKLQKNKSC